MLQWHAALCIAAAVIIPTCI